MNPDDDRVWVDRCYKWRYSTRPIAMDKLAEVRRLRGFPDDAERAVHWCRRCRGWHLTNRLQWEINNIAPDLRGRVKKGTLKA